MKGTHLKHLWLKYTNKLIKKGRQDIIKKKKTKQKKTLFLISKVILINIIYSHFLVKYFEYHYFVLFILKQDSKTGIQN